MPKNNLITITGNADHDGVDTPWFEWKYGSGDTVQWKNDTDRPCQIIFFQGVTPISQPTVHLAPGATSHQYPLNGQAPEPTWPPDKVYKFYKYQVKLPAQPGKPGKPEVVFDPGGGARP